MAGEINGLLYGRTFRMVLPRILSAKEKARWVFFIVCSGAPLTYISAEVSVHPHRKNAWAINLTLALVWRIILGLLKLLDTFTQFTYRRQLYTVLM